MSAQSIRARLEYLHEIFTESNIAAVESEKGELGLPLDAARCGVIRAFLKDNEIISPPGSAEELGELRDSFNALSKKRGIKLVQGAQEDMEATG